MKLEKFKEKNNKKIGILIFTTCCILLIAGVYLYSSFAIYEQYQNFNVINGTVIDPGDLYFTFYVDDIISKTMPAKGSGYTLDTEKSSCTNGAVPILKEDTWSIKVNNFTTTHTKCTLYFKEYTPTAADIILEKGENSELAYDKTEDNNLRYIGKNPNNYVSFNNELWRIIGVFNNIDDGTGAKETRLKIIKNDPYSEGIAWDTGKDNDWSNASLQNELNTTYLNSISSPYQEMIDNAIWPLGGMGISSSVSTTAPYYLNQVIASDSYKAERDGVVAEGNSTEWTGKIALMYPSDYGFATSGGSTTSRDNCLTTALYNWHTALDCINSDWIYNGDYQWTLTHLIGYFGYSFVSYLNPTRLMNNSTSASYTARPTLYLSSDVQITGGTGSESDPFTLSL